MDTDFLLIHTQPSLRARVVWWRLCRPIRGFTVGVASPIRKVCAGEERLQVWFYDSLAPPHKKLKRLLSEC